MHGPSVWKWQRDALMRNMKYGWNEHAIVHMFVNHMEIAFEWKEKAKGVWHANHVSQYLHCYGHRINRLIGNTTTKSNFKRVEGKKT